MKKRFLYVGLAALAWGVLYALGMVDTSSLMFCPVFGAINYVDFFKSSQAGTFRGAHLRWMQVDPLDGSTWAGASDYIGNDAGSIYGSGELQDVEVMMPTSASPMKNVYGKVFAHSITNDDISVRFNSIGTIAKYTTLGAGNGVYYSDAVFNSAMDNYYFRLAVYLANEPTNEAGTNGAFIKFTFWAGRFILESSGYKASDSGPRIQTVRYIPISVSGKTDLGFRNGGQTYTRKLVAALQGLSAAETWDSQAEVTVN